MIAKMTHQSLEKELNLIKNGTNKPVDPKSAKKNFRKAI